MRHFCVIAAAMLVATPAAAEPKIEECSLDIRSTEGASAFIHSDDGEVKYVEFRIFGETGQSEIGITPLTGGDAVLLFRELSYSRNIAGEGPMVISIADSGRAVVRGGDICDGDGCFVGFSEMTRAELQGIYNTFLRTYPGRQRCVTYYSG